MDAYLDIITGKTAHLIQAACQCGAVLAKAESTLVQAAMTLLVAGIFWHPALVRAQPHEPPQNEPVYVGTTACKDCHQALYESYLHGSKKARSSRSVKRMNPAASKTDSQARAPG